MKITAILRDYLLLMSLELVPIIPLYLIVLSQSLNFFLVLTRIGNTEILDGTVIGIHLQRVVIIIQVQVYCMIMMEHQGII